MRVLILHQYYLGPGQAGGARFNVIAQAWAKQHQVCVIADQRHYLTAAHEPAPSASWCERADDGPVQLWRVSQPMPGLEAIAQRLGLKGRFISRAQAFGAYALGAMRLLLSPRFGAVDVVIASSPSLTVLLPGLLAKAKGAKLVFEVRDLWPESAITAGVLPPDGALTRLLSALERIGYRRADAINALTPAIAADIKARCSPRAPIWVYPNGAELEAYADLGALERRAQQLRGELGLDGRFIAMYAGAHGLANGLELLNEAAAHLREHPEIALVAVGDGPERSSLIAQTARLGLSEQVRWLPAVPYAALPAYLRMADVGLVLLRDVSTFKTVYPNKLFEMMACGLPVICNIPGQAQALLQEAGAGAWIPAGDARALAQALLTAREQRATLKAKGQAGRAFVARCFDRKRLAQAYLEALETL